jgi:hypothetical protein
MSPQPVSSVLDPTYSAVNSSDTIQFEEGLLLMVRIGGTATTVTITPPGNQEWSGVAKDPLTTGSVTSDDRFIHIHEVAADTTGIVTVAYSNTTGVTAALLKH